MMMISTSSLVLAQCRAGSVPKATEFQALKALYQQLQKPESASNHLNVFSPDVLKLYRGNNYSKYEGKTNHRTAAGKGSSVFLSPAPVAVPSNDTCSGAQVIPAAGSFPYLTTTVDITGATLTGDPATPSCTTNGGPISRGVWYTFTPSNSNRYEFSTCADQGTATTVDDTTMAIYTSASSCTGPYTEIATTANQDGCDDDTCNSEFFQSLLTTTLNSGTQYYIVIFNRDSSVTAGNAALQLKVTDRGPVTPPANDTCDAAQVIPTGAFPVLTTPVDVTDATTTGDPPTPVGNFGQCDGVHSRSVWYSFTPTVTQDYTISSCQSDAPASTVPDIFLAVYTSSGGCAGPFTQRHGACDFGSCTTLSLQAKITTRLEAGTQYYVVAWKDDTNLPTTGNTTIQLSVLPPERNEGPGIYYTNSTVFLRDSTTPGSADFTYTFGDSAVSDYQAISGDWNRDGIDTMGLYNPNTGEVFLAPSHSFPLNAAVRFTFGATGQGYIALVGDWDNDGQDTIGLYDPVSGTFFLKNANSYGEADIIFQFGAGGLGFIPVAGDYDNDGTDTVGLFLPSTSTFFLRNSNTSGAADLVIGYGPGGGNFRPVVGDWNGDGADTVGVVAVSGPSNGAWFLRNSNSSGPADITPFTFGTGGGQPIAGDWSP